MARTEWFNSDAFLKSILPELNEDIRKAAEPILQEALEEIEIVMRKRLGAFIIARLDQSFDCMRNGNDLIITVRVKGG